MPFKDVPQKVLDELEDKRKGEYWNLACAHHAIAAAESTDTGLKPTPKKEKACYF